VYTVIPLNVPDAKNYKPASLPFADINSFPMVIFYNFKKTLTN
jgi:hypothetical protein